MSMPDQDSGKPDAPASPIPCWLQPGSRVVTISGRDDIASDDLTIEKVGKRDVVLSNGVRFNRTAANMSTMSLYKRGEGAWTVGTNLYPSGAPEVERARHAMAERRRRYKVLKVLDNIEKAVRNTPDWPEVIRLHGVLGRLLDPRGDTGSEAEPRGSATLNDAQGGH